MKKYLSAIAVLLVISMVLVGCSSASSSSAASSAAASTAASSEAAASSEETSKISEAAELYPSEQVFTWITQDAGNIADTMARIIGKYLSKEFGQTVTYDNLGGAAGMNSLNPLLAADADGYQMASLGVAFLCLTPYSQDCTYTYEDFEMLHCIMQQPQFMVVSADAPYDTFEEWKVYVEENPGEFRFGVPGISTVHNLCLQALKLEADLDYNTVAYSAASEVLAALLGGHIEGLVLGMSEAIGSVESGDLKIICFTTPHKGAGYEEYPSLEELGYEARGVAFQGICIKAGTDPDVVDKLVASLDAVFSNPDAVAELEQAGGWYEGTHLSPEEFSVMVKDTYEFYGRVLTETGLMEELYG